MVKLVLDRREIWKDICMIVFQIINNQRPRSVVDEFGALVKKSRVVLVSLDNKVRARAEASRNAKVGRHPPNQETRIQCGVIKNPGKHAGGRGLAVCAGYCEHPAMLKHMTGQPLGPGGVVDPRRQHRFHRGVTAGQRIADDHAVGRGFKLFRVVAVGECNATVGELGAHGRVNILIRARDSEATVLGQQGQAPHKSAANTEYVNMIGQKELPRLQEISMRTLPLCVVGSTVCRDVSSSGVAQ